MNRPTTLEGTRPPSRTMLTPLMGLSSQSMKTTRAMPPILPMASTKATSLTPASMAPTATRPSQTIPATPATAQTPTTPAKPVTPDTPATRPMRVTPDSPATRQMRVTRPMRVTPDSPAMPMTPRTPPIQGNPGVPATPRRMATLRHATLASVRRAVRRTVRRAVATPMGASRPLRMRTNAARVDLPVQSVQPRRARRQREFPHAAARASARSLAPPRLPTSVARLA